jgi:hypothetical protein
MSKAAPDPRVAVDRKTARSKRTKPEVLVALSKNSNDLVSNTAIANPNFPLSEITDILEIFFSDPENFKKPYYYRDYSRANPEKRNILKIIHQPKCPAFYIERWIKAYPQHPSPLTHPNCPSYLLDQYIPDYIGGSYVARNPNISREQALKIMEGRNRYQCGGLVKNKNVPEDILYPLIYLASPAVLQMLVNRFQNPEYKQIAVSRLASRSYSKTTRSFVARKSNNLKQIERLGSDMLAEVRESASKNPNATKAIKALVALQKTRGLSSE